MAQQDGYCPFSPLDKETLAGGRPREQFRKSTSGFNNISNPCN
jgi:hypothetical protein